MSARLYTSLVVSAVVLGGCVHTQPTVTRFATIPGAEVQAGIPCSHVAEDRRASVQGCETFVSTISPEMSHEEMVDLNTRFRAEVQVVVNFDFDRDELRPDARRILDAQAEWIKRYPDLRFSVFGHTDLVGSLDYNFDLAKRRADAVVAYLLGHGIPDEQLEAVVSFGETQPVIDTTNREERNRRTVTEVSGYLRFAGRTAVRIPCSWLDPAYLPTYGQCISTEAAPRPPVTPPSTNTPRPPVEAEYSGPDASGWASITENPDGSVTSRAGGITGPESAPRTETEVEVTEEANGSTGNLSASVTDSRGNTISASVTHNADGTTTSQGGTQSVTH